MHKLLEFKWDAVLEELKTNTQTLLAILQAAAKRPGIAVKWPAVVMATAILLKTRSSHMCQMQRLISSVLYAGHASKKVNIVSFLCIVILLCA